MGKVAFSRTNLLLDASKVRQLRRALRSRSNSEAIRRAISERLAAEEGLRALRDLSRFGGLDDLFARASVKGK